MRITVLGTGNVGTALTEGLVAAGHDVVIGSRHPNDNADASAPVTDHSDAVRQSDIVINALPGWLDDDADHARRRPRGKILLDVSTAITESFELAYPSSSLAEHLQKALPDTLVVKSLNTFNTSVMTSPSVLPTPGCCSCPAMTRTQKATIASLLVDLGWPTGSHLDLGGIETAKGPEHYFFLFFGVLTALGSPTFNIDLLTPDSK